MRKCVALAKEFEDMLLQDERFEVVFPTTLGLVCFRYKVCALFQSYELVEKCSFLRKKRYRRWYVAIVNRKVIS